MAGPGRRPARGREGLAGSTPQPEVHVKAADPQPISDDAAKYASVALGCDTIGWRVFQWLARDLVPDPSVVLGG